MSLIQVEQRLISRAELRVPIRIYNRGEFNDSNIINPACLNSRPQYEQADVRLSCQIGFRAKCFYRLRSKFGFCEYQVSRGRESH